MPTPNPPSPPIPKVGHPCDVCGTPVPPREGRGRPALFCSDDCRDLRNLLRRLSPALRRATARMRGAGDPGLVAASSLRVELFKLSNIPNQAGRPAKVAGPNTKRRTGWRGLLPEDGG